MPNKIKLKSNLEEENTENSVLRYYSTLSINVIIY